MMKQAMFFLLILSVTTTLWSQTEQRKDSLVSIDQLGFMIGNWEGEGWIVGKDRAKKTFTQSESIVPKVNHTLLVIDGIGHSKEEPEKVIHNAFGVISYNDSKMTMLSYSTAGDKMENEMLLTGDKTLEWSFKDERGGTIKFSEDFSTEGIWKEKGEYSFDGENWFQFFEMTLKKQ